MSALPITVIGVTEAGEPALGSEARRALTAADVVFGGERHLRLLDALIGSTERVPWSQPLSDSFDVLDARRDVSVVVLASGDPHWHGIANTLVHRLGADSVRVLPAVGVFSLAASALGWPLEQVHCRSLHGHDLSLLSVWCFPGARLLLLTDGAAGPRRIADTLCALGWERARCRVLSQLGGAQADSGEWSALDDVMAQSAELNVVAIDIPSDHACTVCGTGPGLPDDAFEHDGQLTKRSMRAVTLARLRPMPQQCLWDVGAGCGSVAIEWVRAALGASAGTPPRGTVLAHAIERDAARVGLIERNCVALGTPQVRIHNGDIRDTLRALPAPHAVFIGGGLSQPTAEGDNGSHASIESGLDLIMFCREQLLPGGRLVANAVTLETEAVLMAAHARFGGELERVSISASQPVGRFSALQPSMPVLQYTWEPAIS